MKTAIITGASTGIGVELTLAAYDAFPEIEEYWLIARREDRLSALGDRLSGKNVRIFAYDLCDDASYDKLSAELRNNKPEIALLICNAGCGYLGNVGDGDLENQTRTIDLNIKALTAMTHIAIPYIAEGGRIINLSSIASFCPNPRMTVYSSSKAYVSSFSRGLREELRIHGITVTAVCPGPMSTEFIEVGRIKGNSKMFDTLPYCDVKETARGAIRAAQKGRAVYTPKFFYKFYRVLAKILPQSVMVKLTKT